MDFEEIQEMGQASRRRNQLSGWGRAGVMAAAITGVLGLSGGAQAVDVIIGPDVTAGEHLTMTTAAIEANAYPDVIDVRVLVTPGVPWPGVGTFSRPVMLSSRVPGLRGILAGAVTFESDAAGSIVDSIHFIVLIPTDTSRLTAYGNVTVRDSEFSGLAGEPTATRGGGLYLTAGGSARDCYFHDFASTKDGGGACLAGGTVELTRCVFESCSAANGGGGLSSAGAESLVLKDCVFVNCSSETDGGGAKFVGAFLSTAGSNAFNSCVANNGGGLFAVGQCVSLQDCAVSTCISEADGGGIWAQSSEPCSIAGTLLVGNSAGGDGGSIYAAGPITVTGAGAISDSSADGRGGAICLADGARLEGYLFFNNDSGISGGAVHLHGAGCTVEGEGVMTFESNLTGGTGGAISTYGIDHHILNVRCELNTAGAGGAIGVGAGNVSIESCEIIQNDAGIGGGLYATGEGVLSIQNSTFELNEAGTGGGLYLRGRDLALSGVTCASNLVALDGGGIYLFNCTGSVTDSLIHLHEVVGAGGGVRMDDCVVSFVGCDVLQNIAGAGGGGGLYADGGSLEFHECLVQNNYAIPGNGGGLWADVESTLVEKTTFDGNAGYLGGGMFIDSGSSIILDSTVSSNVAQFGGGTMCRSGSLALEGSLYQENEAQEDGGGVLVADFGSFTSVQSQCIGNSAFARGGGVFLSESNGTLSETDLYDNFGNMAGGGLFAIHADVSITGGQISANQSGYGGGMHVVGNGFLTILAASINFNVSGNDGGGISVAETIVFIGDRLELRNNQLTEDSVGTGTAVFGGQKILLTNSLIANNGSGPSVRTSGQLRMSNSTVVQNAGGILCVGGESSLIANSILWGNLGDEIDGTDIIYSCVDGGAIGGGNIDEDPGFVDPWAFNYSLEADSPCFDAGKDEYIMQDELDSDDDGDVLEATPLDLPGNSRVMGEVVDMGAYEIVVEAEECQGDLDGNGVVDIDDLLGLFAVWDTPEADINSDGVSDINDLLTLISAFGACP